MTDNVQAILADCLTVRQVADKLGVSWQAVYQWIKQGRMPTMHSTRPILIHKNDAVIPPRASHGPDVLGRPAISGAKYRGKQ